MPHISISNNKKAIKLIASISKIIKLNLSQSTIIESAIVHPSKNGNSLTFERLEFLGDKVLGICLTYLVFQHWPEDSESSMSIRLANYASADTIFQIAQQSKLDKCFITVYNKKCIVDLMEALLAVIFLEHGLQIAQDIIHQFWQHKINSQIQRDNKTLLQELSQKFYNHIPEYTMINTIGPSHQPIFTMQVIIDQYSARGHGHSKQQAEQDAAGQMLQTLAKANIIM